MSLSQRRRHSRWRMFLVLLVFVGLVRHSELTSAGIPESSSLTSASPAARKRSQDIGSLNDFSWQAWVMVEQAGAQPGADSSATLLRRIMPKSIFIAPQLQACSDGYVADEMNRCVKNVDIDEIAHFSFLLHRLNNMYGNSKTNPPSNGQSNGPLQLNIPLMPDSESKKVETMDTLSANDPLAVVIDQIGLADDKKIKHEASTAAAHEVKNDTVADDDDDDKATKGQAKKDVEETTFFPENPRPDNQVDKSERKPDAVPVAEFVEETGFSEVVNYKIPADLKTNASNFAKGSNASDGAPTTDKRVSVTEIPPLMQLLLSSTTAPSTASEADGLLSSAAPKNSTVNRAAANHSSPAKETDNASDFYEPPPAWKPSDERRENETRAEDEPPRTSETHETDFIYDEEVEDDEYAYGTDVPDEESTEAEGEEILKHGEAGMTIPTRSPPGRLHHKQNQTADRKKTTGPRDQVRYNDTAEKDEAGSNISSEVSIDGDLILETTLLDVNTERLQVTTQSPDATTTTDEGGSYDHRTIVPEVVLPPKDTGAQNRAEQTTQNERRDEALEAVLSPLESYDPPEEVQVPTGIRTIDEERPDVSSESVFPDSKDELDTTPRNTRSDGFVRFAARAPTDPHVPPVGDYVQFPGAARQSQQQGYVRFPSNEANSIHSLNHKHQSSREAPSSDGGGYAGSSTKSSVRQKPVYQLTPSWKPDERQQDERVAAAGQRQKAPVLRLWSKMPPIRDPSSIFPVDRFNRSEDDDDSLEGGQQPPPARHLRRSSSPTRRSSQRRVDKARERRRTPISG